MQKRQQLFAISLVSFACVTSSFAAIPIDLKHQPISVLQSIASTTLTSDTSVKQISSDVDFNQTTHIRFQQTYAGHPVWGSESVAHIPKNSHASLTNLTAGTTMNGTIYKNLNTDLSNTPAFVFTAAQADKALQQATQIYQKKTGINTFNLQKSSKNLIVYIDKENKAHWAFVLTFLSGTKNGMPAAPTYILDAVSLSVYEEWDDLQTLGNVNGGGFGGNPKLGKLTYDGLTGDYPILNMKRDALHHLCTLKNDSVSVLNAKDAASPFIESPVAKFTCDTQNSEHNNIYWYADQDAVNGGYSPADDALYIGQVIKDMYKKWYNVPVLSFLGFPMMLKMNVHAKDFNGQVMDNAFFLSLTHEMYFGDGVKMFYPLTSLGVGAHEISHGFTSQHSNLIYKEQSGGLNEAYSDMAAQAAEFYSTGHNSWQIGPEIVKGDGALRYMDDPTKDGRSIANLKDYYDGIDPHLSSGIFNKIFYLIGSAPGWDAHKAFNIMVKANMHYWTANTTFTDAACGVVSATKDYKYDLNTVTSAMTQVGIDVSQC